MARADLETGRGGAASGSPALPPDLPDHLDDDAAAAPSAAAGEPSLTADIEALLSDGKTYLEAEVAYQKSRAGFAANRLKWTAIYGAAAFGLLHLALIALTVGAVIALAPVTGPWIATAIVAAVLLAGAGVFVLRLRSKLNDVRGAFDSGTP